MFGPSSQDVYDNPVSINLPAIQGTCVETTIYKHNHFHVPRLPSQLQHIAIYVCCILGITTVSCVLQIEILGYFLLQVVRSFLSFMILILVIRLGQIVMIFSQDDFAKTKNQYLPKLESRRLKEQSGSTSTGKQAVVREPKKNCHDQKFEEINRGKLYKELMKRSRFQ